MYVYVCNFGAKIGLPVSGDANVSCCALAVVSNYFKTNSVWYFRIKFMKTAKLY